MKNSTKWMYQWWWKLLGIVIFLYVLIGGLTTPLNPGITSISPAKVQAGDTVLMEINGYNTNFLKARDNDVWLKMNNTHMVKAHEVLPYSDMSLEAQFIIPSHFPTTSKNAFLTIITYNPIDGPALKPSALYVSEVQEGQDNRWVDSFGKSLIAPEGIRFPFRSILDETIRNTFFHVALWLSMIVLLLVGLVHSILYLRNKNMHHDLMSAGFNKVAIFYGILGLITGSIWAKHTWGTWWTTDIKLNMSAIAMLIYLAYLVLRASTTDFEKRARLSAVYSIFSFAVLIPLIFVIPRLTDSLHPGNGGNPALGGEDLDNTLRLFFYPSIIGLILIGTWISSLIYRSEKIEDKILTE